MSRSCCPQVGACLLSSSLDGGLRVRVWTQIVNSLPKTVVIGTGHFRLELGERDVQVVRDVECCNELPFIVETRGSGLKGHAGR